MTLPLSILTLGLFEFAPILRTWFKEDHALGKIFDQVINLAKQIGGSHDLSDVIEKFRTDPAKVIEFQKELSRMEAEVEIALITDRQNARNRELSLISNGKTTTRADFMVFAAVIGLALCLGALGFYGDTLPGEAVGIISTISGIFGACLKDAYAFEFGSSRGSRQKDETLATMAENF